MNSQSLSDLIALGEGFTTEFKLAMPSMPSALGREICAFANATGGVILLGVADDGTVCRVAGHNRLKSEIQSIARSAEPSITVEVDSVGEVLYVRVPAQDGKPYSFGGKYFIREGALSQQMSRDEIRKFFYVTKLQSDIELVTLERLITRYEEMIGQKLKEQNWQVFFTENPFILSLAFGYPVIKVQDQASVGGRKLSGLGEKIADFLVKNSMTNNTAIFEIKTPQADLLNKTPIRSGIYTPSSELAGAINQALDQKYQFQTHIASVKHNSRIYDMESYSVHCCLIIGATPSDEDQQKSFELFRGNSKDVEKHSTNSWKSSNNSGIFLKGKVDSELADERINGGVNEKTLSALLALGEGFTTEFKQAMPSDLGRDICAFTTFVYAYCISKLN